MRKLHYRIPRRVGRVATPGAVESLEARRLMAATTVSIPVPPALDGWLGQEEVVDIPDGFQALFSLNTTSPALEVRTVEGSVFSGRRAFMEFPLAGVPVGSRVESAQIRFHVSEARGPIQGGLPDLEFTATPGNGRLTREEFYFAPGRPWPDPFEATIGGTLPGHGLNVVPLAPAPIQKLLGRASHLGVIATGGQNVTITSAEGAARTGVTRPTLVLRFTPPAQPVPAPPPIPSGTITGRAFIDTDRDGVRDAGEAPATEVGVYLDANRNGVHDEGETNTRTDPSGTYRFAGLTAGTYRVRVGVPAGAGDWRQTAPAARSFGVTLASSRSAVTVGGAFGLHTSFMQVRGTAFEDRDADGVRDPGERGIAHRQVFIDQNNNGRFDSDARSGVVREEPHTYTDIFGNYFLYNQGARVYVVREVRPAGWRHTTPSGGGGGAHVFTLKPGQVAAGKNFGSVRTSKPVPAPGPAPLPPDGASVSGRVFEDDDGDGVQDADEFGADGTLVFIDRNRNGVLDRAAAPGQSDEPWVTADFQGNYRLAFLGAGTHRVAVPPMPHDSPYRWTAPAAGYHEVTLAANQDVRGKNFGLGAAHPPISGAVFEDLDGDGARDAGEGPANVLVYVDLNRNGRWEGEFDDVAEPEPWAPVEADGTYAFDYLRPGTYRVRVDEQLGRFRTTAPAAGYYDVTVADGRPVRGRNFGVQETGQGPGQIGASIEGASFEDADADGVYDEWSDGFLVDEGWSYYIDSDRDGVKDAGERSAEMDRFGGYRFAGLEPGTYRVRAVPVPGWRTTGPAAGYYDVAVARDQPVSGKDFGYTRSALARGAVFNDLDRDGVRDGGEAGLAGWRAFLDADNDGSLDAGERSVLTDAAGNYTFNNLAAGTYRVRVVQQSGWSRTAPGTGLYTLTLSAGQTAAGKNFGQRRT